MVGLGELSLPESLAGRLESQIEARARVESQSVESFRRLDVFLGGLLAVLQQMDADMQRCPCPFKHDAPARDTSRSHSCRLLPAHILSPHALSCPRLLLPLQREAGEWSARCPSETCESCAPAGAVLRGESMRIFDGD